MPYESAERSAQEVLDDHLQCRKARDIEADIERNYWGLASWTSSCHRRSATVASSADNYPDTGVVEPGVIPEPRLWYDVSTNWQRHPAGRSCLTRCRALRQPCQRQRESQQCKRAGFRNGDHGPAER